MEFLRDLRDWTELLPAKIDINFIDINQGLWDIIKKNASRETGKDQIVFFESISNTNKMEINIIRKELKSELVEENCMLYIAEIPEKGFSSDQQNILQRLQHDKKAAIFGVSLLSKKFFDVPRDDSCYEQPFKLQILKKEIMLAFLPEETPLIFLPNQVADKNFEWIKKEIFKWAIIDRISIRKNRLEHELEKNQKHLIGKIRDMKSKGDPIVHFINSLILEIEVQNYFQDKEENNKLKVQLNRKREKVIEKRDVKVETLESATRDLFNPREYKGGFGDSFISKYSDCFDSIRDFLNNRIAKSANKSLSYEAEKQGKELSSPILVLPLVGVFCSGKTTLINAIIGKEHRFRTDATHNTAILSKLHYEKDKTKFRVEFQYKNNIDLILSSLIINEPTAFTAKCSGKIKNVKKSNGQAKISVINSNEQESFFYIPLNSQIQLLEHIKPGLHIDWNTSLTTGIDKSKKEHIVKNVKDMNVEVKKDVIDAVINLMEKRIFKSARLSVWKRRETSVQILNKRLLDPIMDKSETKYELEFRNLEDITKIHNRLKEFRQIISKYKEKNPLIHISGFNGIYKIDFTAEVNIDHKYLVKSKSLTDMSGWEWFQGKEGREGFAEKLDNVLILDWTDVFLDHELLKSVWVVDTPGLGSIADRHDEITEQFLRQGDTFIIMIELRKGIEHQETYKLLNFIRMILNEKHNIKDTEIEKRLFFFLNWFSDRSNQEEALNHANKFKKILCEEYGWQTPRVYLCDLHEVIYSDDRREEIGGYPSISKFREDLKDYVDNNGIVQKLKDKIKDVNIFLRREKINSKRNLESVKEKISYSDKCNTLLFMLKKNGYLTEKAREEISKSKFRLKQISNKFKEHLKGLDTKELFEDISQHSIGFIEEINEVKEDLEGILPQLSRELETLLKDIKQKPSVKYDRDLLRSKIKLIPEISVRAFQGRVREIINDWPGFFRKVEMLFKFKGWKSYEKESRKELVNWSEYRVRKFCCEYFKTLKWIEDQWKEIIKQSYSQVKKFQDSVKSEDRIDSIKVNIREIEEFQNDFRKLRANIEKILTGGTNGFG
jgi:hypothetical protein